MVVRNMELNNKKDVDKLVSLINKTKNFHAKYDRKRNEIYVSGENLFVNVYVDDIRDIVIYTVTIEIQLENVWISIYRRCDNFTFHLFKGSVL